ncbi:MAG: hypothetical protein ACPLZY_00050 [Candidatus Norongarragalinales archaeon]
MSRSSLFSVFYKLSPKDPLAFVKEFAGLTDEECALLQSTGGLPLDLADRMIENVAGAISIPLGIGVNFLINGRDYLIPITSLL